MAEFWGVGALEGTAYPSGKPIAQLVWWATQLIIRVEPSVAGDILEDFDKNVGDTYGEKDRDEFPPSPSPSRLWQRCLGPRPVEPTQRD